MYKLYTVYSPRIIVSIPLWEFAGIFLTLVKAQQDIIIAKSAF